VEGSAPSEKKEKTAHRVRAGNVGAPATLGSFAPTDRKNRMMVINLDNWHLIREPPERAAIRREQRERLENKHRGKT
jgi:hypothetical protein